MSDRILIVDDDEQLTDILCLRLESSGYETVATAEPGHALELLRTEAFSLALLDLKLGEYDGIEVLSRLREVAPDLPIFMITAHGDVDSAVQAFTLGADGYIRKPFKDGELQEKISQSIDTYRIRKEAGRKPEETEDVRSQIRSLDPAMEPILRRISMAAQVTSNVVITGESGTGKERAAQALHQCGPRRSGPFVAFNCAALPESLLEAELFGYVRGAFTDAKENKPGLFAMANGGTLFLDEIGDAPFSIQAKLLRVLQEREVLPVGGTTPSKIDVRVVAATHRSLQVEVAEGRFRQDLFYRLHVLPIHLPALRERPKDILFLANLFATDLSKEMGMAFEGFTATAEAALLSHDWPGNIRELQNRIEHALATSSSPRIVMQGLFPEHEGEADPMPATAGAANHSGSAGGEVPTFGEAKTRFERGYLERILTLAKGNIARAARIASKSRTEVYSLLKKHQLDPGAFKDVR